jgi:hypothetical protein
VVAVGDCIGDAADTVDEDDVAAGCGTGGAIGAIRTPGATGGENGSTTTGAAVTGAARLNMSVAEVVLLGCADFEPGGGAENASAMDGPVGAAEKNVAGSNPVCADGLAPAPVTGATGGVAAGALNEAGGTGVDMEARGGAVNRESTPGAAPKAPEAGAPNNSLTSPPEEKGPGASVLGRRATPPLIIFGTTAPGRGTDPIGGAGAAAVGDLASEAPAGANVDLGVDEGGAGALNPKGGMPEDGPAPKRVSAPCTDRGDGVGATTGASGLCDAVLPNTSPPVPVCGLLKREAAEDSAGEITFVTTAGAETPEIIGACDAPDVAANGSEGPSNSEAACVAVCGLPPNRLSAARGDRTEDASSMTIGRAMDVMAVCMGAAPKGSTAAVGDGPPNSVSADARLCPEATRRMTFEATVDGTGLGALVWTAAAMPYKALLPSPGSPLLPTAVAAGKRLSAPPITGALLVLGPTVVVDATFGRAKSLLIG